MIAALAETSALFIPTAAEYHASLPEIVLIATMAAVLIVPLVAVRTRALCGLVALVGLVAALILSLFARPEIVSSFGGMLVIDPVSHFWRLPLLACTIGVSLLWLASEDPDTRDAPEFFTLLVGAALGMSLLVQAGNLLMLLVALEITSMPSYVLAGFRKSDRGGAEASIKYVLFGAASTAVLLFCSTFLFGSLHTLDFTEMSARFAAGEAVTGSNTLLAVGLMGLLIGLCFKLAAVPLHLWCPDVFQGASVEVAAFLSIASKGAALLTLGRLLHALLASGSHEACKSACIIIAGLGVLGMTLGNLAALRQRNLKRLLAYSSIAQAGYMLTGLAGLLSIRLHPPEILGAILVYIPIYLLMNLGAFAVAGLVQHRDGVAEIADLRGLGTMRPIAAASMALLMFSLVGLPPLAGFSVKLNLMLLLGSAGGAWWVVVAAIGVNSAMSLAYYGRVVRAMYLETGPSRTQPSTIFIGLAVLCAGLLIAGFLGFSWMQSTSVSAARF